MCSNPAIAILQRRGMCSFLLFLILLTPMMIRSQPQTISPLDSFIAERSMARSRIVSIIGTVEIEMPVQQISEAESVSLESEFAIVYVKGHWKAEVHCSSPLETIENSYYNNRTSVQSGSFRVDYFSEKSDATLGEYRGREDIFEMIPIFIGIDSVEFNGRSIQDLLRYAQEHPESVRINISDGGQGRSSILIEYQKDGSVYGTREFILDESQGRNIVRYTSTSHGVIDESMAASYQKDEATEMFFPREVHIQRFSIGRDGQSSITMDRILRFQNIKLNTTDDISLTSLSLPKGTTISNNLTVEVLKTTKDRVSLSDLLAGKGVEVIASNSTGFQEALHNANSANQSNLLPRSRHWPMVISITGVLLLLSGVGMAIYARRARA